MYRAFLGVLMLLALTLSIGCGAKEIDPEESEFKANTEAAATGAEQSFKMQEQYMRPEQKAYFQQMQERIKQGPGQGGVAPGGQQQPAQ
jgi:hypothetical protein